MATNNVNLMWKDFKGIRNLNTINSGTELGADIASNILLSKEKSGQQRSIKSSGWFNDYATLGDNIIRLFGANLSGYAYPNQLIVFTNSPPNIRVWLVEDDSGVLPTPVQIADFSIAADVTDVSMTQFGDRLVVVCAFGNNTLGFITYSATSLTGWTDSGNGWFYRLENIAESTTSSSLSNISQIKPYGSRLAINGQTVYSETGIETIFGVWFSETGNPLNFTKDFITAATDTSAFFVETGEYVNSLEEYNGLTAFCRNRSYNISGSTQNNIKVQTLTAKGVFGNATFVMNGQCAYIDSYSDNIFFLTNQIDGTIGVDSPIGNDIQDYIKDVGNVTVSTIDRRVRIMKATGEALIYDVDTGEWTTEMFNSGSRCATFLNKELMTDGTATIKQITAARQSTSRQLPNKEGYYSYYKTNLIWLDSQTSVKSHIYPLAVILEAQTNNDFFVKFTTDRKDSFVARVTRSGFVNIATYSENDNPAPDGSKFVESDDDLSGRIFFSLRGNDLLVTIDRPPYWRYLQMEIYTNNPNMEFNISGIEAKQTFITDEMLDY